MSPDQQCTAGTWCPYACPSGQLSAQWDPSATTYSYPESMNGGLYCNDDGTVSKGFSDKPYCYDGAGTVTADSSAGDVAFCQTVLPGNEAMLIPTMVSGSTTLAVPDTSYWDGTAAHYYVNPPGVSTDDGCVWGSTANPWGNWAPYVAGANTDNTGVTYVEVGWNPVYLQDDSPYQNTLPNWGLNITCPDGGCTGLPCGIDPSVNGVNECSNSAVGAGGATFCVVGVQSGKSAVIDVFSSSGSASNSNSKLAFAAVGDGEGSPLSSVASSTSSISSIAPSSSLSSTVSSSSAPPTTTSSTFTSSSSCFNSTSSSSGPSMPLVEPSAVETISESSFSNKPATSNLALSSIGTSFTVPLISDTTVLYATSTLATEAPSLTSSAPLLNSTSLHPNSTVLQTTLTRTFKSPVSSTVTSTATAAPPPTHKNSRSSNFADSSTVLSSSASSSVVMSGSSSSPSSSASASANLNNNSTSDDDNNKKSSANTSPASSVVFEGDKLLMVFGFAVLSFVVLA